MASDGSYLVRRGATYSFRRRFPVGTAALVGRANLTRSLKTDQARVGRFLSAALGLRWDGLMAELSGVLTRADAVAKITEWFDRTFADAWLQYRSGALTSSALSGTGASHTGPEARRILSDVAEITYERLRGEFANGDYSSATPEARKVVASLGMKMDELDQRFRAIEKAIMEGMGEIQNARMAWSSNDDGGPGEGYTPAWEPALPEGLFPSPKPEPTKAAEPPAPVNPATVVAVHEPSVPSPTLMMVFDRYAAERKPKPATARDFRAAIRRFEEVNGALPINRITKGHVVAFKDAMLRMPQRLTHAMRALTVPEIVSHTAGDATIARVSATTVNEKGLAAVKVVLNFGVTNDLVAANAATSVKALGKKQTTPSRLPYTNDDLKALFGSEVFTLGVRPTGGAGEAAIWLPLLAAYTGARLEELGILTVGDVREEEGVPFIAITEGKTVNAIRKVPIHSALLGLGFRAFVTSRGKVASTRLFPGITSASDKETSGFSKWWGRYAREFVPERNKVFHSFRHSAKRELRNNGVEKALRDALMGHDNDDVAESYGRDAEGQGFALPVLQRAIELIRYGDLAVTIKPAVKRTTKPRKAR